MHPSYVYIYIYNTSLLTEGNNFLMKEVDCKRIDGYELLASIRKFKCVIERNVSHAQDVDFPNFRPFYPMVQGLKLSLNPRGIKMLPCVKS